MQSMYEGILNFLKRFWYLAILAILFLGGLIFSYCHHNNNKTNDNLAMLSSATQHAKPTAKHSSLASKQHSTTHIYVEIKGAVNHPGIYLLNDKKQRLFDALQQAGGLQPDADTRKLNLAQQLKDQDSFYIPKQGENIETSDLVIAANHPVNNDDNPASNSSNSDKSNNQINLNTATATDLQKLSGVGPKKAEKIINYRNENGKFKTVDDLKQVAGIGEKTLEMLKPNLCV